MQIRKADHIALLVKDVERSCQFYGQVLGMEQIPRPSTFDFPGAWFSKANFQVHLIGEAEPGRAAQAHPGYRGDEIARGYGSHVAFEVDDLAATIQHLQTHDVQILGGPRPRGDGVQQMYVCDPDGYIVEFFVWDS